MNYVFHKDFIKAYTKLSAKPKLAVDEKIRLFKENPFSDTLRNHHLKGKYMGYNSINITGDYRVHFKVVSENELIFVRLGTHSQLYG